MGHNTAYVPKKTKSEYIAQINQFGTFNSSVQTSGTLTIGRTYRVSSVLGDDNFDNVGKHPYIDYFIATGETPNAWTSGTVLAYNSGAPLVVSIKLLNSNIYSTSVKNTFIDETYTNGWSSFYFLMVGNGEYLLANSNGVFSPGLTIAEVTNPAISIATASISCITTEIITQQTIRIKSKTGGNVANGIIGQYCDNFIKITVYS